MPQRENYEKYRCNRLHIAIIAPSTRSSATTCDKISRNVGNRRK